MNFTQSKLTKQEWESIEVPLSGDKIKIIRLIVSGFNNINITYNETNSILTFLKIDNSKQMDDYLYNSYFSKKIDNLYKKYEYPFLLKKVNTNIKIKGADKIRISNNSNELITNLNNVSIYEFIMLDFIEKLLECNKNNDLKWVYYYFTINAIQSNNIKNINLIIKNIINSLLSHFQDNIDISYLIYNSVDYIEKNDNLIKYSDISLYDHQKNIFTVVKDSCPKLILYIAPTGTGKTLTPLGLSEKFKVIYVCAARHVGLSLAKAAISIEKKIAFAFGCNSSEDIRLHYYSAKEYSKNKKSGGIKKIDNSFGEKVEIIICDIRSYLPAMYYMLAHFNKDDIISYFDEPTIFLDYQEHPLHLTIHKNWKDNLIPNIVLSSATLPKSHEIPDLINDFKDKFENSVIHNIVSYECKKTIPIIDSNGFIAMPHYLFENYDDIKRVSNYCINNLTLLRYLDLKECVDFIKIVNDNMYIHERMSIYRKFTCINDINMFNIKEYYIKLLQNIIPENWNTLYETLKNNRNKYIDTKINNKIKKVSSVGPGVELHRLNSYTDKLLNNIGKPISKSESYQGFDNEPNKNNIINIEVALHDFGIYITTRDAYTLTDGPTLFITNCIDKISEFCIKQSNIPTVVMKEIMEKINYNEEIKNRIVILEKELEDIKEKKLNKDKNGETQQSSSSSNKKTKISLNDEKDVGVNKIKLELENLYPLIRNISLNETFVPNKIEHLKKWNTHNIFNSFTSDISDDIVIKIMSIDVEVNWKILLLLGIGVFAENNSTSYNEIIKELAESQKLYLIIANSDYIYGVNYQFCHTYIGKDMNMTQEKIIQALGRVGRGNIQQTYTIRFRNDSHLKMLFDENPYKPEVYNMNALMITKDIYWDNENKKYCINED